MSDKNVSVKVTNDDDEELAAGSIKKGEAYPKNETAPKSEVTPKSEATPKSEHKARAEARPKPPKDLVVDQFNPDGSSHHEGGWAVFEYPSPQEMAPSIDRVRDHVEDRVRKAGYTVDSEIVAYNKDDESFRVAVRYS